MRGLTASEILHVWETAHRFHPIDQVLSILLQVLLEQGRDELAALPLGRRDALLLALRKATFGDALPGKNHCPQCGETVEFEVSCSALAENAVDPGQKHVNLEGYMVTVRPLNSFDLAAAAGAPTLKQARDLLLQRCVDEVLYQGETIDAVALPEEILKCIGETIPEADPQAEMLLNLDCPDCRHQWQSLLDIGHVLWLEISTRAQRLLMEVHLLAKAYGWTEAEILKLSATRRSAYLQMVTA